MSETLITTSAILTTPRPTSTMAMTPATANTTDSTSSLATLKIVQSGRACSMLSDTICFDSNDQQHPVNNSNNEDDDDEGDIDVGSLAEQNQKQHHHHHYHYSYHYYYHLLDNNDNDHHHHHHHDGAVADVEDDHPQSHQRLLMESPSTSSTSKCCMMSMKMIVNSNSVENSTVTTPSNDSHVKSEDGDKNKSVFDEKNSSFLLAKAPSFVSKPLSTSPTLSISSSSSSLSSSSSSSTPSTGSYFGSVSSSDTPPLNNIFNSSSLPQKQPMVPNDLVKSRIMSSGRAQNCKSIRPSTKFNSNVSIPATGFSTKQLNIVSSQQQLLPPSLPQTVLLPQPSPTLLYSMMIPPPPPPPILSSSNAPLVYYQQPTLMTMIPNHHALQQSMPLISNESGFMSSSFGLPLMTSLVSSSLLPSLPPPPPPSSASLFSQAFMANHHLSLEEIYSRCGVFYQLAPWNQSFGMEKVWTSEFNRTFSNFHQEIWSIRPVHKKPTGVRLNMFVDSAKVRFCCENCNHSWTSMKGRVVFWFALLPPSFDIGLVAIKLFGQRCESCKIDAFEQPMWYPEEVIKVLANLYSRVGQMYYGFEKSKLEKQRRMGKPRNPHNRFLCQACMEGICLSRGGQKNNLEPALKINNFNTNETNSQTELKIDKNNDESMEKLDYVDGDEYEMEKNSDSNLESTGQHLSTDDDDQVNEYYLDFSKEQKPKDEDEEEEEAVESHKNQCYDGLDSEDSGVNVRMDNNNNNEKNVDTNKN